MLGKLLKRLFKLNSFRVGLVATLVVVVSFLYGTFNFSGSFLKLLDKQWVDFILKERDPLPVHPALAIAVIDTESVDALGRWPWPRRAIAELVEALNEYEVRTMGFDVVFSEEEHLIRDDTLIPRIRRAVDTGSTTGRRVVRLLRDLDGEGDRRLARALRARDNVVLGYFFFGGGDQVSHLKETEIKRSAARIANSKIELQAGSLTRGTIPIGTVVESNIKLLHDTGMLSGYFNMQPDPEDGSVRRVHMLTEYKGDIYPSLSLQMLRNYLGVRQIQVDVTPETGVSGIHLGDTLIRTNYDGSVQVNYKGPSQTIPHISVKDIITRTVPKEDLKDKLVLIGATEVGIFDLRTTPVEVNYPGVEVHATLLENILTESYFHLDIFNDFITAIIIILLGIILSLILSKIKNIYSNILIAVFIIGYTVLHRYMVNSLLTWISYIFVVLDVVAVWLSITLYRFFVTDKDRRFIKGAFQQYLSPQVIDQLTNNPDLLKLGGERRVLTAFFSDVASFSTVSEGLDPVELVALLNEYLTQMTDIITANGGTIDKYEGDAIIAFFGAPIPYENHASRSCEVALAMQEKLADMRVQWKKEKRPELYMRIGMNTGPMVVGNMGSEKRFDYTMMGHSVNLASRLEGANKNYGTPICVSEFTYESAKGDFEFREIDLIRVVGINKPVRIYEVVARIGKLTPRQKQGYDAFAAGLAAYRQMQWDESRQHFQACQASIPADKASSAYIDRCQAYKTEPPVITKDQKWSGIFEASSK